MSDEPTGGTDAVAPIEPAGATEQKRMRSPLRPRFPDRSGCHGRDLTTRVRSARRAAGNGEQPIRSTAAITDAKRQQARDIRFLEEPDAVDGSCPGGLARWALLASWIPKITFLPTGLGLALHVTNTAQTHPPAPASR